MARILVVDDEPHVTSLLAVHFRKGGHEVRTAADGEAALELLRAQRFDLLIADVAMPKMDGLTLISHREVIDPLKGVIVLTCRCDYARLKEIEGQAGIRIAPKPFSPSGLTKMVEELLGAEGSVVLQDT